MPPRASGIETKVPGARDFRPPGHRPGVVGAPRGAGANSPTPPRSRCRGQRADRPVRGDHGVGGHDEARAPSAQRRSWLSPCSVRWAESAEPVHWMLTCWGRQCISGRRPGDRFASALFRLATFTPGPASGSLRGDFPPPALPGSGDGGRSPGLSAFRESAAAAGPRPQLPRPPRRLTLIFLRPAPARQSRRSQSAGHSVGPACASRLARRLSR